MTGSHRIERPSPLSSHRISGFDGMRAIAVSCVFALHLDRAHFPGGALGVDVFFVLSAYLITSLLFAERDRTGSVRMGDFYWRRFFRLGPALAAFLPLASLTAVVTHEGDKVGWSIAGCVLYISDFLMAYTSQVASAFDQTWSLAVEEQFYLVWPAVLVFALARAPREAQRILLGLGVVAATGLALTKTNYFLPSGHLLPLVLGCWAAEQNHRGCGRLVARTCRTPGIPVLTLLIFAAYLVHPGPTMQVRLVGILVALGAASTILALELRPDSRESSLLSHPLLVWVGVRSYGIYLYGLTLLALIPAVTHLSLTYAAPVDIIATTLVVGVSFRYLERPAREHGRQWLANRRNSDASAEISAVTPTP